MTMIRKWIVAEVITRRGEGAGKMGYKRCSQRVAVGLDMLRESTNTDIERGKCGERQQTAPRKLHASRSL